MIKLIIGILMLIGLLAWPMIAIAGREGWKEAIKQLAFAILVTLCILGASVLVGIGISELTGQ